MKALKQTCKKSCKICKYPCVHIGSDLKPITIDELYSMGFVICDEFTKEETTK